MDAQKVVEAVQMSADVRNLTEDIEKLAQASSANGPSNVLVSFGIILNTIVVLGTGVGAEIRAPIAASEVIAALVVGLLSMVSGAVMRVYVYRTDVGIYRQRLQVADRLLEPPALPPGRSQGPV